MRDCEREANEEHKINPEELRCVSCKESTLKNLTCATHGEDFIDHKCQYCCNYATWFCWGKTRFCEPCHNIAWDCIPQKCKGPEDCPFNGDHPENGKEHCLGCRVCNEEKLNG